MSFKTLATGVALVGALAALPVTAATVWDGPTVSFSKPGNADPTLGQNQDRVTDLVFLTRGSRQGLYNAAAESAFAGVNGNSPAGTEWAFEGLGGNPTGDAFSAQLFDNLEFDVWTASLGGERAVQGNILGRNGVLHLLSEDVYIGIEFTEWSSASGGGAFSYDRTSVVPLPAALPLMLGALAVLGGWRRVRCRAYG